MGRSKTKSANITPDDILTGLKAIYKNKIKPLEDEYNFEHFYTPSLTDSDIQAKPLVLLLGQYSVGKSSFIKYLLGKEYPGCHIGPEPTTDRFIAIMGGEDRTIPGNAAAVSNELPFNALTRFGSSFLQKFEVAQVNSQILENVTLIDTPGVLSGEKQRIGRSYDFCEVISWFAQRADAIVLLFDAHKLDISDEFKRSINALKGNEEKIKVVLNKADMINGQQLMRVYGALMWSLGKVFETPEVTRVYIGSFWDNPINNKDCEPLLKAEQKDLLDDLKLLPKNAIIRKMNSIVKRAMQVKIHAIIISHLKQEMPKFFGKKEHQNNLITNLEDEFLKISAMNSLAPGDFPNPEKMKEKLLNYKLDKFPKLDKRRLSLIDEALSVDLPKLMQMFPMSQVISNLNSNPFATFKSSPNDVNSDVPSDEEIWDWDFIDRASILKRYHDLKPVDGKLSGSVVRPVMEEFGLDKSILMKIWKLADWTKDGYLDPDEFIVAIWMCEVVKRGWREVPDELPRTLIPNRKI